MLGYQSKCCPNSKDNTTNTYIKELCLACKNLGLKPPEAIFPEYDYARLTVKKLYPKDMYAKPGEKLLLTEPAAKKIKAATARGSEQAQPDEGKLKVPKVVINDDEPPRIDVFIVDRS
jgi:hypothetical protein